ncbi:hypothetical protein CBP12_00460 [Oceanisphaera avium]|uniref:Uncharacterized protein n=1 Tax=Oceanisphaera avium TaxID=1903694 RepID=A0A1Y0CTZ4_9GAMM|nr:hypothetical protein CBP12_00460 [Oceanisphaera avium]
MNIRISFSLKTKSEIPRQARYDNRADTGASAYDGGLLVFAVVLMYIRISISTVILTKVRILG